jgi:alkylation response protein AidB-like acyl-CoA dehydrogenase
MSEIDEGRERLLEFDRGQPENFWRADEHARSVVGTWAGEKLGAWENELDAFGGACAGAIDRAVREANLTPNLPRLERWSDFGERVEEVAFHPSHHQAGRLIYGSGVMKVLGEWGNNLRSMTLFYLSAQNGEAGHNCPLACTAGIIKALRAVGDRALQERWLPRLLSTDYDELAHGAQFLTEVQGGSDVGANAVRAVPAADGTWRIHGEKWFCSNATADLILMTARPEGAPAGTRGLGLFLVPRRLEGGELNAFRLRRLKDKLGTRSMASAEIDFDGARAWAVGPVEKGFSTTMTWVINTSRLVNAFGCAGIARRAFVVARGYARARRAFGQAVIEYPLVQETLADMRAETAAMVSGSFYLAHLFDRGETGKMSEGERAFARVALNLNKMRTAMSSHEVALSGIEVLGGNGAIESFSVLPRLLRDNVVYENWEGTHNVLVVQVLRDARTKGLHEGFFGHLATIVNGTRLTGLVNEARLELEEVLTREDGLATLMLRPLASRLAWLCWAAAMSRDGSDPELCEHFVARRLAPPAPKDGGYLARVARLAQGG